MIQNESGALQRTAAEIFEIPVAVCARPAEAPARSAEAPAG